MPAIARVGDIGNGTCRAGHPGVPVGIPVSMSTEFITGASTVFLNNVPIAVVGTVGATNCGHHTEAVVGSPSVFAENVAIHLVGDTGIVTEAGGGDYETIVGSSNAGAN